MHIPAGAFLRDPDGDPMMEFDCTFRYDATLLAVTNTVPPVGGTFSPPAPGTYQYDVNWNEAVEPTSVQASDLTLSGNTGATVTNVEVINGNTTTRFTLNIPFGGSLTADIAAGRITDQFGNPNAAFSGSYTVKGLPPSPTPTATPTATATATPTATPTASPTLTPSLTCVPRPPDMVSWWPGDGTATDIAGPTDGALHEGAVYGSGMAGEAVHFDGVNDYMQAPATGFPFGSDDRTLEMWVNIEAFVVEESFFGGYGFLVPYSFYGVGTIVRLGNSVFLSSWGPACSVRRWQPEGGIMSR